MKSQRRESQKKEDSSTRNVREITYHSVFQFVVVLLFRLVENRFANMAVAKPIGDIADQKVARTVFGVSATTTTCCQAEVKEGF